MSELYPAVRVTDAPGYEDFDGWLIASPDGWPWWVVGFVNTDGKRDVAVVNSQCVTAREEN